MYTIQTKCPKCDQLVTAEYGENTTPDLSHDCVVMASIPDSTGDDTDHHAEEWTQLS